MKKVLIVRTDAIGDFVIFTAVLNEYARVYQGCEIDLLCHPSVKPLAEVMPYFKRILCVEHGKFLRKKHFFYRVMVHLRMLFYRYDVVIFPLYSRDRNGDEIIRFIRAPEKIAFDGGLSGDMEDRKKRRDAWFTRIIVADPAPVAEIERNAEFINKMGGCISEKSLSPRLWFKDADQELYQTLCQKIGLRRGEYICFFPGARMSIRLWDIKEWVAFIRELRKTRQDATFVFLGGPGDRKVVREILEELGQDRRMIDMSGSLDLRLTAKFIEGARLLVSMETSAIHFAAAVRTPNVCIIGGGHFGRFYPYGDPLRNRVVYKKMDCFGCNWCCKYSRTRCILEISHHDVLAEVERLANAAH